jgi:hypothetical protein
MSLTVPLQRNLLLTLGLLVVLSAHSAQPSLSLPEPVAVLTPVSSVLPTPKAKKKGFFSYPKKVKQLAKQYFLFYKKMKKKSQGGVVGSTVLIALLMALGLGGIIFLLSSAGISGILVTLLALVGFGAIIYWAVKRIRWNMN